MAKLIDSFFFILL